MLVFLWLPFKAAPQKVGYPRFINYNLPPPTPCQPGGRSHSVPRNTRLTEDSPNKTSESTAQPGVRERPGCEDRTWLGPPAIGALSHRFFFGWEGSPTKIDYRKRVGTLVLTSLLEDLGWLCLGVITANKGGTSNKDTPLSLQVLAGLNMDIIMQGFLQIS